MCGPVGVSLIQATTPMKGPEMVLILNDGLNLNLWNERWRKKKEEKVERTV